MEKFLKENWFKIGLLIILGIGMLFWNKSLKENKEEVNTQITPTASSFINEDAKQEQTKNNYLIISNQLKTFDDFLEYKLIGAQIDCITLATYNNILTNKSMDSASFQQAFPDTKESYKEKCQLLYLDVVQNQKLLIAEPELRSLRTLLTSYSNEVKSFGLYALEDGSDGSIIDSSDKKMDDLRTLSREEVINLKRKYDIN